MRKRSTRSSSSSSPSLVVSRHGCIWHQMVHLQALHLGALALHLQAARAQPRGEGESVGEAPNLA